jgi:hypothetical protein
MGKRRKHLALTWWNSLSDEDKNWKKQEYAKSFKLQPKVSNLHYMLYDISNVEIKDLSNTHIKSLYRFHDQYKISTINKERSKMSFLERFRFAYKAFKKQNG